MRRTDLFIGICMAILLTSAGLKAQQANSGTTGQAVTMNRLITFSGTLKDSSGQPRLGTAGITFGIYTSQEGGDPLWRESQTVQTDEQGRYTVLLGSTEKEGLPLEVFSNGRAQWLGVEVQGEKEQARVLLWAVPYALKAADADTVGGKPLSSFVLYADLARAVENNNLFAVIAAQGGIPGGGNPITSRSSAVKSGSAASAGRAMQSSGAGGRFNSSEGTWNSLFGQGAGGAITSGVYNSLFGYNSGGSITIGQSNSIFGDSAGRQLVNGYYNAFFGDSAGYNNTASDNSFFGSSAGVHNTTAGGNSFFGKEAGKTNTTATGHSFFGYQAGLANTTGGNNSFFGYQAGSANTTGDYNSFFGYKAGTAIVTSSYNAFFGEEAGTASTACCGAFFGRAAGYSNTTGSDNSYFGNQAGYANTSGTSNAFFGRSAGLANTTASGNSFFGKESGYTNTTGTGLAFFGYQAGRANTGTQNSFFGYQAGLVNTAGSDSFFGYQAGVANTTGSYNAFFGRSAGAANTTGEGNTFMGAGAGDANQTGIENDFFGWDTGGANTTGSENSFFGDAAGVINTTGAKNSFFGRAAGLSNTTENANSSFGAYSDTAAGITNATAVGYRAKVTQSNSLVLGGVNGVNGATANTYVGIGTTNPATELQVISTKSTQPRGVSSFQFSNDNLSAIVRGGKARGTATSPSAVQAQDGIFNMQADGYGATGYLYNIGGFQFAAEATFTNSSAPTYWRLLTTPSGTTAPTEKIRITGDGNIGIGTTAPTERLHVVGNIRVTGGITYGAPETDIPDYVFEPDYKLMRIEQLEKFIGKEKHLPNMPQASEIKEKGLNLSEFQMKLLEKIEELTLYTVQQAKTINRKDEEIKDLNARLTALEQMMERRTKP